MNRGAHKGGTAKGRFRSLPTLRRLVCRLVVAFFLYLPCLLFGGCAASKPQHVDRSLMREKGSARRNEGVPERYPIGCPDVLEITVVGRPEYTGRRTVRPDGRIDLGELGQPRVEGRAAPEVIHLIAGLLALPPEYVDVRVAEYHSQVLYLFGEVNGLQRTVPYRGQETVLDLLQRAGGITSGAAPDDVFVVRSRILDGQRPEVFHVDLRAIVLKQDQKTNLRLQPFDQIHVGATRRARLEKCFPPWLRPLYQLVCGLSSTPKSDRVTR